MTRPSDGGGGGAGVAPAVLVHVNLLLCMVGGATLASGARLKWDPSAYVPLRALCPREYAAAAAALAGGGAALLLAAHVAAAALQLPPSSRARRPLLLTYAAWQTALWAGGWAWGAWTARRLAAWLRSEAAAAAAEAGGELRAHLRPLLALLARYHPLPEYIDSLIQEVEEDAPRNLYVAAAVLLLTALLLPLSALLAMRAARRPSAPPARTHSFSAASVETDNDKAPLRAAYRGGRLVLL